MSPSEHHGSVVDVGDAGRLVRRLTLLTVNVHTYLSIVVNGGPRVRLLELGFVLSVRDVIHAAVACSSKYTPPSMTSSHTVTTNREASAHNTLGGDVKCLHCKRQF